LSFSGLGYDVFLIPCWIDRFSADILMTSRLGVGSYTRAIDVGGGATWNGEFQVDIYDESLKVILFIVNFFSFSNETWTRQ
jgi:hypothetical protein